MKFKVNIWKSNLFLFQCFILSFCVNSFENELYASATTKFKIQTQNLLENMYTNVNYKSYCEDKKHSIEDKSNDFFLSESKKEHFDYMDYDTIVSELTELSREYPRYLKLTTGQKEFNLPHPSGECGKAR
jgi:hypothetical protein